MRAAIGESARWHAGSYGAPRAMGGSGGAGVCVGPRAAYFTLRAAA